jgi:CRP-like cAMP-binding protein
MFRARPKSEPTGSSKHQFEHIKNLHASGKTDEAMAELRALIHKQPKARAPRVKLADWLVAAGQRDEGISELYKLQELLSAQGNLVAAISAGLKIVEIDPSFDNPLSYVAKVNSDRLLETQAEPAEDDEAEELDGKQHRLSNIPLLSDLEPAELLDVAREMNRRILYRGAVLVEAGDRSRSLHFVVSGTLEIRNEDQRLDTAGAGQCLGEFAFQTGEPRSATIVALEEGEVLELSEETMRAVVERHPRIAAVLDKMYHGRVLARVLAESPLFGFLEVRDRHRIASLFHTIQIPAGIEIVSAGSQDGALFLVKSGRVEIRAPQPKGGNGEEPKVLDRVGPNEFFGEVSFLTGVPRTASVVAVQDCELLKIDQDDLRELASEHPRLIEVMKDFHVKHLENALRVAKGTGFTSA